MSRLNNLSQMGYFPLPPAVGEMIASYITAPNGGKVLDPCAGEAAALIQIASQLNLEPFGIEPHPGRAEEAQKRMAAASKTYNWPERKRILHNAYLSAKITDEAFNLLYENPPYMFVDDKLDGRAEYQWLKYTTPYLQTGGLLIWVVPQAILKHSKTGSYLSANYENFNILRFPDGEFEVFDQIVVFATRKNTGVPAEETSTWLKSLANTGESMEALALQPSPMYELPPCQKELTKFRGTIWTEQELFKLTQSPKGILQSRAIQEHLSTKIEKHALDPLMPLKIGHLVSIIAAGHLNNQVIDSTEGKLLLKGQSYKKIKVLNETEAKDGGGRVERTKYRDEVVSTITTVNQDGVFNELSGEVLSDFMADNVEPMTQLINRNFPPRYKFDLNGFGPTLNRLNLTRKVPFYDKPGLLPAQKHAAAAAATHLKDHRGVLLIGMMGTGKTVMATAVAAALHNHYKPKQSHMVVLCPPHLQEKWIREIHVTWPQAKAMPLDTRNDVDKFFRQSGPIFGVMRETTARAGSGWSHAIEVFGPTILQPGKDSKPIRLTKARERYVQKRRVESPVHCPTCGHRINDDDVPAIITSFQSKKRKCVKCGHPLYQDDRKRQEYEKPSAFLEHVRREQAYRAGRPMILDPLNQGYARQPLASYIARHYKGRIALLIADECHQFKGVDSDRGYAFHRLCESSKKILAGTGTIYGGKASSIFDLFYRMFNEFREHFTDKTKRGRARPMREQFVKTYGILETVETKSFDEHGKQSGNTKESKAMKELPGSSPALYRWIVNNAVFINLRDLGVALPPYEEIPIQIQMSAEMEVAYKKFSSDLREIVAARLIRDDKSLLGAYLQSLISWPDSPWRNKFIAEPKDPSKILCGITALPAPPGNYPKEREIINLIVNEKKQGRKCLLLCQQTETLDITPQWVKMLADNGIKAAVLKAPPKRREAWVAEQVKKGIDVIITHPKRIETGLDLLDFPTEIWMGTEFSVYTVMQASRRGWRIGQTKPVKVYFFVYHKTLQSHALHLIASKVAAAMRVNGDAIEEDSLAEMDDLAGQDLVATLTKILLDETDHEEEMKIVNAQYELAQNGQMTGHFKGCLSAADVKKRYRELARKHHPDVAVNGDGKVETLADAFKQANSRDDTIGSYDMTKDVTTAEEMMEAANPDQTLKLDMPAIADEETATSCNEPLAQMLQKEDEYREQAQARIRQFKKGDMVKWRSNRGDWLSGIVEYVTETHVKVEWKTPGSKLSSGFGIPIGLVELVPKQANQPPAVPATPPPADTATPPPAVPATPLPAIAPQQLLTQTKLEFGSPATVVTGSKKGKKPVASIYQMGLGI